MGRLKSFFLLEKINREAKREAFLEMIVNTIFALLPIWLAGGVYGCITYFTVDQNQFLTKVFDGIVKNISNGELLMYSAATLGPMLYLGLSAIKDEGTRNNWLKIQVILAVLINIIATVLFFSSREYNFASNNIFISTTAVIYLICLFLLFPSMAFDHDKKQPPMVQEAQDEDLDSYMKGYKRHRG